MIKTLVSASLVDAALIMFFFGLGTLPAMLLVTLSGAVVGARMIERFVLITAILIILMGSWTLYEGIVFYDIMRGLAG